MGTNQSAAYAMILKRKSTQRPVEEQLPESKRAKTLQDRGTKGTEDDVIDLCNSDDEDPPQTRNVESKTAANGHTHHSIPCDPRERVSSVDTGTCNASTSRPSAKRSFESMKKDATSATSALQDDGCGRQRRSFRKRDWNTSKCHSSNAAAAGPADDMRAETARGRENAKDRIVEEQLQRIQDLLEQKDRRILELEHELQVEKQNRIAQEQQAQKWRDQAEQCQCRHTLNSVGKVSTSQVQSDADNLDELRAAAKQAEEVQRAEQLTRLAQEAAKERAAAKRAIVERQKAEQLQLQQQQALNAHRDIQRKEAKAMEEMKALKATMRKLVEEADYLYKPYNLQGFMHHLGYMTFQGASFPEPAELRSQLRQAKRMTHPDKQLGKSPRHRALAEEAFKTLHGWEAT